MKEQSDSKWKKTFKKWSESVRIFFTRVITKDVDYDVDSKKKHRAQKQNFLLVSLLYLMSIFSLTFAGFSLFFAIFCSSSSIAIGFILGKMLKKKFINNKEQQTENKQDADTGAHKKEDMTDEEIKSRILKTLATNSSQEDKDVVDELLRSTEDHETRAEMENIVNSFYSQNNAYSEIFGDTERRK